MPVQASFTIGYHKMCAFCTLGSRSKRLLAKGGGRVACEHADAIRITLMMITAPSARGTVCNTATVTAAAAATTLPFPALILSLLSKSV